MVKIQHSLIDNAYKTLKSSHKERLLFGLEARLLALKNLRSALLENEDRIVNSLKKDLGRPHFETYALEIAIIKEEIERAIKFLPQWSHIKPVKTPLAFQPGRSYVEPTPKGVVLIIAPWNYPFQLSLLPLVSAIAAGNCAILKPSELAHESGQVLHKIINTYLDNRCFRVILGEADTAKSLLELPFDHIFYTGSIAVGQEVMRKAAEHLTPVTLELGGKCPALVYEPLDLSLAAKRLIWGKCLNAGQTCIAPDYVLIEKKLINDFIVLLKKHLLAMFGSDSKNCESFGRIVNRRHVERLSSYLSHGHIAHGGAYDLDAQFFEPTILSDVKIDSLLMQEEIFGPILPLIPVESFQEGIDFINARPHPLAIYGFTKKKSNKQKLIENTLSGSVVINDCVSQAGNINLPFGGVGMSGMGRYHGFYGFETFSHLRAVHERSHLFDNPIRYAPYSKKGLKIAKALL